MLIPDLITLTLSFLSIPDRLSCRLVCRLFVAQTPSPFRLAGDVLELSNAFDICSYCECKNSGGLRCGDKCRANESGSSACWFWQGADEESALDATEVEEERVDFLRKDPRRRPEYEDLARAVLARSYMSLPSPSWASRQHASVELQRFKLMLHFSAAAAQRLADAHLYSIQRMLDMEEGSWNWSCTGATDYMDNHEPEPFRSEILAFNQLYVDLFSNNRCRYNVLRELMSLSVAAEELYADNSVYWYRADSSREIADRWADGHVGILCSSGSSHSIALGNYSHGMFDMCRDYYGTPEHLPAYLPGSDAHFEALMDWHHPGLEAMFGAAFCGRVLDPFASVRALWPGILERLDSFEYDSLDGEDEEGEEGEEGGEEDEEGKEGEGKEGEGKVAEKEAEKEA
jgi:hypothetical protein